MTPRPWTALQASIRHSSKLYGATAEVWAGYMLLLTEVDSFGRASANPIDLLTSCYPGLSGATPDSTGQLLDELERRGLIQRYEVGGRALLLLPDWDEKAGGAAPARDRGKPQFPPPGAGDDWTPIDELRAWKASKGVRQRHRDSPRVAPGKPEIAPGKPTLAPDKGVFAPDCPGTPVARTETITEHSQGLPCVAGVDPSGLRPPASAGPPVAAEPLPVVPISEPDSSSGPVPDTNPAAPEASKSDPSSADGSEVSVDAENAAQSARVASSDPDSTDGSTLSQDAARERTRRSGGGKRSRVPRAKVAAVDKLLAEDPEFEGLVDGEFGPALEVWLGYQSLRRDKPLTPQGARAQIRGWVLMGAARFAEAVDWTVYKGWLGLREGDASDSSFRQWRRDRAAAAGLPTDISPVDSASSSGSGIFDPSHPRHAESQSGQFRVPDGMEPEEAARQMEEVMAARQRVDEGERARNDPDAIALARALIERSRDAERRAYGPRAGEEAGTA